ncbi:MAG TPA: UbiA family prenyltransferase [Burkholderiaceae bacterium]|nr:UbiA family prenyltransferase [Burkholderiaceae bacterium]
MLTKVGHLLALVRFSHTIFALPFAMLAAVMAWNTPAPEGLTKPSFALEHWIGIVLCMIGARSAAMAFNRLADHKLDALNPRTQGRHIPAGLLTVGTVILFTVISSAIFVAGTLLFLPNILPIVLAVPVLLGLTILLWVAGFDIIYACQDYDYDVQARLRSVPAKLGILGALRVAALCHLAMVVALVSLPLACPQLALGWLYWAGIAGVAGLLVYEHWLVGPTDLSRINAAFFRVNAVVSVGLFVIGAIDMLT